MVKLRNIKVKCIVSICLIILSTSFLIDVSVGEENQSVNTNDNTYSQGYDGFGDTVRLLASLLFVLALIVGGVYLLKKVPLYKRFAIGTKNPVSILSSISLGQKRSISVVRVADEILILGLTNTNISLLSKMKADEYCNSEDIVSTIGDREISESNKGFLGQLKKAIQNKRYK
ncbi:MAG: Flagellar protein [Candidatus Poribacteria bacterium]|nr:Flagellar protein [Candidatus Poribacteria bacterium]